MPKVIVAIKPSGSSGANGVTRYIAESKRDPQKESLAEHEGRPLFSSDVDGLTYQEADALLGQGEGWFPETEEVVHMVVSLEPEDYQELGENADERRDAFRELVRDAAEVIEKEIEVDELHWVAGIHLNTDNPHAHVAISRYGMDRETSEIVHIDHIPKTLLPHNERDEQGEKVFKPGLIAETIGKGIDINIVRVQEQEQARQPEPSHAVIPEQSLAEQTVAPSTESINVSSDAQTTNIEPPAIDYSPSPETDGQVQVMDSNAEDPFFGLDTTEPETDFGFEPLEPKLNRADQRIQDRETIGRSMVARAESERLDAELTSLIEHGDKRRFRVLDATHGRTRQISEFDIKRRADTRAAAIVKDKEIIDPEKRHLARQVQYETELHAHDHGIRAHQIIVNKSIKKTARDLENASARHSGLKAEVRAIQAQYRNRGEALPVPILSFHDLGKLQDQALSNIELNRFQTLENIRVNLAAEFGRPTRTDKEVARLEGQVLNCRVEKAARHERSFQFERHKHQTRFEIGDEKYSLAELDRQIADKERRSHLFSGRLKISDLLPSNRQAAAAEATRLSSIREVVREKIAERSADLQSALSQSIGVTDTLTTILGRQQKEQFNRDGQRLDKILTRSELSRMVDTATTLSDPAMLQQAYLLEAHHQDRPDSNGKKISTVEQAARALGRAAITQMATRHTSERLQAFEERRSFVPVVVKTLEGKEVTRRLADYAGPQLVVSLRRGITLSQHPIKWLARRLAESKQERHLRKETTTAVQTEHDLLKTEVSNAKQCNEITQRVAENYKEHLTATNQPIPEPVFTTKQIIQLEIQAIREPEQHERDRIMSLISHAEESKHVFTPQALDTKNLVPELNPMDLNEQFGQHESHLKEPSSYAIVTGQHASLEASSTEQPTPSLHPEIATIDAGPDIDITL